MAQVEKRNMKMHPQLLLDVITRQAGTLTKAILEAVMNSVDASASRIDIFITENKITVYDDGEGFKKREEIELYFETFGQPQDNSRKTYGCFHMGRGQLFSFGINHWSSGEFRMDVDLKKMGLDYHLTTGNEQVKGCVVEIELYEHLLPSQLRSTIRDIETWVKYCPTKVYINTNLATVDPATVEWDEETADAYYKFNKSGSMAVYNLGVWVMDMGEYRFGVGGVVVSKRQLKVNFARNDVQSDCPVWKRITSLLTKHSNREIKKEKNTLTDGQRRVLADRYFANDIKGYEMRTLKLFSNVTGSPFSISMLMTWLSRRACNKITIAPKGDRRGDKIMQLGLAYVVAKESIDTLGLHSEDELKNFMQRLYSETWGSRNEELNFVPFEEIASNFSQTYTIVAPKDYTPTEQLLMEFLDKMAGKHPWGGWKSNKNRKFAVGVSDVAQAWTDGASYIALERGHLTRQGLNIGVDYWFNMALLLLHEYCHDTDSYGDTHVHSPEFYQAFHDQTTWAEEWAYHATSLWTDFLVSKGKDFQRRTSRFADKIEKAKRKGKELEAIAAQVNK